MLVCVVSALALATAASGVTISPTDSAVQLIGRFAPWPWGQAATPTELSFDMPGSEIRVRVTGVTNIQIALRVFQSAGGLFQPNGFVVTIDGQVVPSPTSSSTTGNFTFVTSAANANFSAVTMFQIANNLSPQASYDIRVFKATEPQWNDIVVAPNFLNFAGFVVDAGHAVASPALPSRRIEFLGDSITAGYCNVCAQGFNGVYAESFFRSWPTLACSALDAQCHTAAWSGYGMVENCCGGVTTMPSIFSRTLATVAETSWNFTAFQPDVLVVNLGTNDNLGSRPNLIPSYVQTYTDLVLNASKAYGPKLHVFLACGPMRCVLPGFVSLDSPHLATSESYCSSVDNVISAVKQAGVQAYFLDHRGFLNGTFGEQCCGHPSAQVDVAMAQFTASFIGQIMGWS